VARYGELLTVTARRNDRVNGWFICDRGRFADHKVNDRQRPRRAMINGAAATWNEALEALVTRVAGLPPGSIALVGSDRLPLEGALLLPQLAAALQAGSLSYFQRTAEAAAAAATVAGLSAANCASLEDVAAADCIVIHECDLRAEAPLLLLAVRQAWRHGAPVLLVGRGAPLAQATAVSIEAVDIEFIEEAPIGIFDRPVIIFSAVSCRVAEVENLFRAAAKFAPVFAGANGCGAALLAAAHAAVPLETALADGSIKGIIAVEADIPAAICGDIPLIAAIDWQGTDTVGRAEIVLPTTAWVEMDGTFVNNVGLAQRFKQVMAPGTPLVAELDAGHPPRVHRQELPGGDVREAWRVISGLLGILGEEPPAEPFRGEWTSLRGLDPEGEGVLVSNREKLTENQDHGTRIKSD
jgi:NADH-quinone oxidoreductase subunit G